MSRQLDDLSRQFDSVSAEVRALFSRYSEAQLAARPRPDAWSAAECVEHLNITSEAYLPLLQQAFAAAPQAKSSGERHYRMDFRGWLLKLALEPPPRFKVKTPPKFEPVAITRIADVLPRFLALQEQLNGFVARANRVAMDEVKVVSPFSARMRYNLASCFNVMLAHERRHLWQARSAVTTANRS